MINIIIPMGGENLYETSEDFIYPKILTEVSNKTLLEYSQGIFASLGEDYKKIFVVPEEKLSSLALREIIKLISPDATIVALQGETKGAVCTALMAIDEINPQEELLISSADHYISDNLQDIINFFRGVKADAGVLTFESVHPKWSFVQSNDEGMIVQAAEKNAISKTAIAGLYYFAKASDFIEAAKNLIRKDNSLNELFYLSLTLNELVLQRKRVCSRKLMSSVYHNFYDAHAVRSFERMQNNATEHMMKITKKYISTCSAMFLPDILDCFDADAVVTVPKGVYVGRDDIGEKLIQPFYKDVNDIAVKSILADGNSSIIEFDCRYASKLLHGVKIIEWSNKGLIVKLRTYFY